MFSKSLFTFFAAMAVLFLGACEHYQSSPSVDIDKEGQYWQRSVVSEAIYQQGPKVQQMLNRDIARCVVELRELERLGAVKNAIPTTLKGRVLDPDQRELDNWDEPERDEHLYAEHSDYHDFEGCMLAKGWERTLYVPYDVAEKSRENYLKAHIDYKYQSRIEKRMLRNYKKEDGPYTDLNE